MSCCYCGVQSAFVSGSKTGGVSALVCGTCGAPLSAQKARPLAPGKGAKAPVGAPAPSQARKVSHQPTPTKAYGKPPKAKPMKARKQKKRKSLFQKMMSEAFDVIEDIFD
ncbi:MAG: hypothetical protein GJ678_13550 [Rhodobacteraceae bacterium]|nr:hypothetical protein [Paracoccaceae bacterium]